MKKKIGIYTILLSVIIALLLILIFKDQPEYVNAQGDGAAGGVFGLIGQRQGNREPLYLIDTQKQVILVYEYAPQGEGLGLVSARNYAYDRQLEDYGRFHGNSVEKIKSFLLGGDGKASNK